MTMKYVIKILHLSKIEINHAIMTSTSAIMTSLMT